MLKADEARNKVKIYRDLVLERNSDAIKQIEEDIIRRAENGKLDIDILSSNYRLDREHKQEISIYFEENGFSVTRGKGRADLNISW